MTDPTRIREATSDAPDELRGLFRAAARPEPLTPAAEARLATRVATIGATPSRVLAKALPWLLLASAAVAAGVATRSRRVRTPALPGPAPVAAPVTPPPPAAPVTAPEPSAVRAPARRPPIARAAAPAAEDGLAVEQRLLNEAHRALAANPRRALALAEDHARRYPHGQLAAERTLIEIEALVAMGHRRDAEARAQRLRRTAPNSIYGERLDEILRRR